MCSKVKSYLILKFILASLCKVMITFPFFLIFWCKDVADDTLSLSRPGFRLLCYWEDWGRLHSDWWQDSGHASQWDLHRQRYCTLYTFSSFFKFPKMFPTSCFLLSGSKSIPLLICSSSLLCITSADEHCHPVVVAWLMHHLCCRNYSARWGSWLGCGRGPHQPDGHWHGHYQDQVSKSLCGR